MDERKVYQEEIGQYSFEELQDIAEHLDREQFPERFRMVRDEMTKRQLNQAKQGIGAVGGLPERPTGVAILAWLHIIGGVIGGIALVFLAIAIQQHPEAQQGLNQLGMPPFLLLLGAIFLVGLGVASGIGMWKGKRWGWYLGSFYYVYGIVRNANAFILVPSILSTLDPGELADMSRGPSYYYIKHGVRIVIHLLLYVYFFKGNVRAFFALTTQKKWKPIVVQIGICVGIVLLMSVFSHYMT